jgi:hypothetical protein
LLGKCLDSHFFKPQAAPQPNDSLTAPITLQK